jgi:hypothetical protein
MPASGPNRFWAIDFVFDTVAEGLAKMLATSFAPRSSLGGLSPTEFRMNFERAKSPSLEATS